MFYATVMQSHQESANQVPLNLLNLKTGTPPIPIDVVQIESSCRDKNEKRVARQVKMRCIRISWALVCG